MGSSFRNSNYSRVAISREEDRGRVQCRSVQPVNSKAHDPVAKTAVRDRVRVRDPVAEDKVAVRAIAVAAEIRPAEFQA